jgi:hypothetical protein
MACVGLQHPGRVVVGGMDVVAMVVVAEVQCNA